MSNLSNRAQMACWHCIQMALNSGGQSRCLDAGVNIHDPFHTVLEKFEPVNLHKKDFHEKWSANARLNALPISSLGLRMDSSTIRIAVGLRLGSSLCKPHTCHHCGAEVDCLSTHGLSCCWSEGCHHRHAAVNDIVHRTLSSAKIPSRLEPSGLYRSDGKRPDGITMVPWKNGKYLVWDATCPATFATSYTALATREVGAVAAQAEEKKATKYSHLVFNHIFTPVAIETSGAMGPETRVFLKELGHCLRLATGEAKSKSFLLQRLSVAIQRGNAAANKGTISPSASLADFV